MKSFFASISFLFIAVSGFGQSSVEWRRLPVEVLPQRPFFYKVLATASGSLILSSTHGLIDYQGFRINFPSVSVLGNDKVSMEKVKDPHTEDGIKLMCQGKGSNFFFLTAAGQIYYIDENLIALTGWADPPLLIPVRLEKGKSISSIWVDEKGDLFIGTTGDSLIIIQGAADFSSSVAEMDAEGNFIPKEIIKNTRKISIKGNPEIYKFSKDQLNPGHVLIATTTGLMRYKKNSAIVETLGGKWEGKIICTDLFQEKDGDIWFSTLQHGIGFYDAALQQFSFYGNNEKIFSINTLCKKSAYEFVVAITDSLPAVFNTIDHGFTFINDTIFNYSRNHTTDIKMDGFGNLFVVKGGDLYYTRSFSSAKMFSEVNADSAVYAPFIYEMLINRRPYFEWVKNGGMLPNRKEITLRYNENQLEFSCSLHEFWDQRNTKMAWKMDGMNMDWVDLPPGGPDKFKAKHIPPLPPGKYVFRVKAKTGNEDWRKQEASLIINISLPFWQTWWFWTIAVIVLLSLIISFYRRHIFSVRKKEREKVIHEKELLELEAKALRAQMNPHFVFNSMNAIKSLINKNENDAAANYLTTFSKLIRTLFQNSDKREVSLFEELETCRFYTQLEKMRFGDKVQFIFDIDETIDLKDFKVPALILQPFIENAIWHGIMPKESGGNVTISVKQIDNAIQCIIEDDGIGRVLSQKYKAEYETTHQSKGIGLTQSRLELDKLLNEREDAIEIIDKTEASGRPAGTRVIITFKEE